MVKQNNSFPAADQVKDLPDDFQQTAYNGQVPSLGEVAHVPDNDVMNKMKPAYPEG